MRSLLAAVCMFSLIIAGCGGGGGSSGGGGAPPDTNTTPIANAGPNQNVTTGSTVTLNGSGSSDADGDLLTYAWSFVSRPAGSSAVLSSTTAVNPTFTADVDGSYVVSLVVDDGTAPSAAATLTVVAATGNSAPIANAGADQIVLTGSVVTLNGSGSSDANGDPLTYDWRFVSRPVGSTAALANAATVNPTFTADLDGSYVVSLVVDDGTIVSAGNTVLINSIADYASLFLKFPESLRLLNLNGDAYLAGSVFALEITNTSSIPFVCTRSELHNGVSVEGFTEDPNLLGGAQIDPEESVGLAFTLNRDVPIGDFQLRYYLTRPDTGEEFIVFHQY